MSDRACTAAHPWRPLEGPAESWQHPDAAWLYTAGEGNDLEDVYECPHCGCRFSRPVREEEGTA